MYLMYVDESGDTGLLRSPTNFFVLSGLVVHESSWREFLARLIDFRRTLKAVYGLPIRKEIHAVEYVNNRVLGIPRQDRLAILRNTLDELAKMDFLSVTNVVVDKRGKPANYDVFDMAWRTLFQRFENTLKYGNFPQARDQDFGLVISDATAGRKLTRLVRKMAVHNPIPNDIRFGQGYRNVPITRVIEDAYEKDSKETLPIQMADTIAYFLHQRYAPNSYIRRQRATHYFDRLDPILNKKASRLSQWGIVEL